MLFVFYTLGEKNYNMFIYVRSDLNFYLIKIVIRDNAI